MNGNRRVEEETVRSYLTIKPGQSYGTADIDESLKALFATGLFSDVRIAPSGGSLVVTVVENPTINRVSFEGNKKLKDEALLSIVESKPRSVLTRAKVQGDTQRLLEGYRRSGRFGAHVEPKVIELDDGRVNLVFEIDEGDKTAVARINFIGNRSYSDGKLRDVVQTAQKNWLSWLKNTDTYDPDRLAADQERLRRFYLNHGYADFRVVSAVADLDRERNIFFVTFTLDEGEKYTYGDIVVDSALSEIDAGSMASSARTRTGKTYSAEEVEKTLEDLTIAAAEKGYAFVQVRPRGERDYENHTISLTYTIDEGPRVYVERIDIRGNSRTRDYVIRREIDLGEGDAYNRVLVDRAERRLNELGFFESVSVSTSPGTAPDRIVLNVDVVEKATGELSFGVGYSTGDGVIGDVRLSERNFLGRGQYVKLQVGGGENKRTIDFSFTEPYFLGQRISAGFDAYRRISESSSTYSYDSETTGGGIRFGFPITDHLGLQVNYQIFRQEITIPAALKNNVASDGEASLALKQAEGKTIVSSVGYSLVYDTRDNKLDPRFGYYADLTQDFAGVGGDVRYVKTTVEARAYRELVPDWGIVGVVKAKGGMINGLGSDDVRIMDSFFKGGETIRGFDSAGYGPRDLTKGSNGDALGGTMFWSATAELQFPIWGLPPELGLRGAVFADAGSLYDVGDIGTLNPANVADDSSVRSSVGGSIIWKSPFGPLRADFAYATSKEDYDQTQIFRFSGGTNF
ncbi:MAG: outer membrane protein assembly factor BamA [Hyphomicrobiales bacterium]